MSERDKSLARRLQGQSVGVIIGAISVILLSVTLQNEQGRDRFRWVWWCVTIAIAVWLRSAYIAWKDFRFARRVLAEEREPTAEAIPE